jgi:5-methylcytosine-specific restriction endonuclease McrA
MNSVLVLNSDYTPINITSFKRGFTLLYKGKAEVIKTSNDIIYSNSQIVYRPLIIRLLSYVKYKFRRLRVNRHRIMRRDNHSCVYCGSKKNLTIDHIVPKSKGGMNTWSNLVTCCSPCNLKKGDKLLHESGLKMISVPSEPNIFYDSTTNYLKKVYEEYLRDF